MSSINIDSEVSGEDIRNLTMQWNYGTTEAPKPRRERRERRERTASDGPSVLSSLVNGICMLAGVATTVAVIIAVQSGWIDTTELTASLF